jgi:hypothetical protein
MPKRDPKGELGFEAIRNGSGQAKSGWKMAEAEVWWWGGLGLAESMAKGRPWASTGANGGSVQFAGR